ncbi:cyclic-phosphate processing receiver domain-containing protein [Rhodococcoides fascians]|uniref:cyclic-phosphate processing receiver domain-containing protein n=1 Tax=Rhodococcoides fascians TaxID=1828 RepID=UPI00068FBC5F|nr:cyclic-phosphate processing receiver domain-containing protein [Rhodococcus fascians]
MLFVDDERPAPDGWALAVDVDDAKLVIAGQILLRDPVAALSLDHDLGYSDTIMPLLIWMRDNEFWPKELYIHTANEDGEEAMLGFIRANAPAGVLRGYGCNFWGTGPDTVIRTWEPRNSR